MTNPTVPDPIECLREATTAANITGEALTHLIGHFCNAWNNRLSTTEEPVTVPAIQPATPGPWKVQRSGEDFAWVTDLDNGTIMSGAFDPASNVAEAHNNEVRIALERADKAVAAQNAMRSSLYTTMIKLFPAKSHAELGVAVESMLSENRVDVPGCEPALLDTALANGAVITGKPDGSEPITILFTVNAWRKFDHALNGATPEDIEKKEQDAIVEEHAKAIYATYPESPKHPWVERGNSHKQDEARQEARRRLKAALAQPQLPQGDQP